MVLKTIIFIAIFAGVSGLTLYNTEPVIEETSLLRPEAIAECTVMYNISQDAIKNILNHMDGSADRDVKCWMSCIMKKIGMMKDGILNWELCKKMCKFGLIDEGHKAKVDKIVELCQSEVSSDLTDECELAYSMASCMFKYWKELDLPKQHKEQ